MDATLSGLVGEAAEKAREWAHAFPGRANKDELPWKMIEAFDATVRGSIERDRRIEDERDRVLIAAVKLAESPMDDAEVMEEARSRLVDAIDDLEHAVLRFGIPARRLLR